jgi:hypothetical protein
MRHPDDKHMCPLFKRNVLWGECWIVQDIRADDTDMEFAPAPFEMDEAERICEECCWFIVED